MEECTLNIKSRNSKKHWQITIKGEVVEEEVAEEVTEEVAEKVVEEEVAEISNAIETDVNSDWELIVEPSKITIKILQPTPTGARAIADELNQLPIKGITLWAPNQEGTTISILGTFEKEEENLRNIIQLLVVNIMIEFRGDEK